MTYTRRRAWQGFLFVLPALVLLTAFWFYPMANALWLSFQQYDIISPPTWVGVANYAALFRSINFWESSYITLLFVVGVTVPLVALAMALGGALAVRGRLVPAYRVIYFLPWVTPLVGLAVIWRLMYHPHGAWNDLLVRVGMDALPWLHSSRYALLAIILFTLWRSVGYFAVMFLVGIQAIPRDYYEAARLDGANGLQLFAHITWPLLKPITLFVVIIAITSTLRQVESFFLMTGGGPADSTRVLALYIYQEGFRYLRMGHAAAVSVLMLLVIMIVTVIQLRLFRGDGSQ